MSRCVRVSVSEGTGARVEVVRVTAGAGAGDGGRGETTGTGTAAAGTLVTGTRGPADNLPSPPRHPAPVLVPACAGHQAFH